MSQEETPEALAARISEFLAAHPRAVVLHDGRIAFDMQTAKYSAEVRPGRCTLQLWNDARNLSRRVVAATQRRDTLKLSTLRLGREKPETLEIVAQPERRAPVAREGTRRRFLPVLQRMLQREFPGWEIDPLQSAMDLEQSFGPAYARGTMHRGQQAWAVVSVNAEESQATADGILTIGILWLQLCRERAAGKRLYKGLLLYLPAGMATLTLGRLKWLRDDTAQWRLFEYSPRTEEVEERDAADTGNLTTRLVHLPDQSAARERFAVSLAELLALVPTHAAPLIEQRLRSSTELALLLHGLEFARIRIRAASSSFVEAAEISVGVGPNETPLTSQTEPELRRWCRNCSTVDIPVDHFAIRCSAPRPRLGSSRSCAIISAPFPQGRGLLLSSIGPMFMPRCPPFREATAGCWTCSVSPATAGLQS